MSVIIKLQWGNKTLTFRYLMEANRKNFDNILQFSADSTKQKKEKVELKYVNQAGSQITIENEDNLVQAIQECSERYSLSSPTTPVLTIQLEKKTKASFFASPMMVRLRQRASFSPFSSPTNDRKTAQASKDAPTTSEAARSPSTLVSSPTSQKPVQSPTPNSLASTESKASPGKSKSVLRLSTLISPPAHRRPSSQKYATPMASRSPVKDTPTVKAPHKHRRLSKSSNLISASASEGSIMRHSSSERGTCQRCRSAIHGRYRYDCNTCANFTLCEKCKQAGAHSAHVMSQVTRHPHSGKPRDKRISASLQSPSAERIAQAAPSVPKPRDRCLSVTFVETRQFHDGIQCNGCNTMPIWGTRYKCSSGCDGYNLCEECYEKGIHGYHAFVSLVSPQTQYGCLRRRSFYPSQNEAEMIRSLIPKVGQEHEQQMKGLDALDMMLANIDLTPRHKQNPVNLELPWAAELQELKSMTGLNHSDEMLRAVLDRSHGNVMGAVSILMQ